MSLKTDVSTNFTGPLQVVKKLSKWRIVFSHGDWDETGMLSLMHIKCLFVNLKASHHFKEPCNIYFKDI